MSAREGSRRELSSSSSALCSMAMAASSQQNVQMWASAAGGMLGRDVG